MNFLQRTHASLMRHLTPKLIRGFSQKGVVQRKELTFRFAESRDFDAVVKLSKGHFNGYDYLPVVYHDWLEMDNLDIMLAHLGKKLVGLGACFIVDDAKTFVLTGGRVMPGFHGRGVLGGLIKAVEDHVRGKFPRVSRQRLVTSSNLDSKYLWRQILEYNALFYDVTESAGILSTDKESTIESCTKEFFSKVILSSPVTRRLLPSNVLIIDWCPYEPLQSNMDYILGGHDLHFFVEKRTDPEGADPVSFSHGIRGLRAKRVEWLATIYTDDLDLFEAHLLHQFKHACELIKGQFTFSVSLQHKRKSEAGCVQRMLGDILKLKGNTDHINVNKTVRLYEKDFN